jgi:histone acetyltransferase (RNA polymerase elongator complex component)
MKPHEERVVQEKKELDRKLHKLELFIQGATFLTLDEKEKELLRTQAKVMISYSVILDERIRLFK